MATSWPWARATLLPESGRWAIHAGCVALVAAFLCGAPHPGLSIRLALQAPPAGGLPAAAPTAPRTQEARARPQEGVALWSLLPSPVTGWSENIYTVLSQCFCTFQMS